MRALRPGRVRAPWRSRVSRSLQVQKIDSIRWRIGARCGLVAGLVFAAGRTMVAPSSATCVGELAAGVALVADDRSRRRCGCQRAAVASATSRSWRSAPTQRDRAGRAVGRADAGAGACPRSSGGGCASSRSRRRRPAGERRAGLERAAALDRGRVDQHQSSWQPGLCAANTPISHSIVSASRARRLCSPAGWAAAGTGARAGACAATAGTAGRSGSPSSPGRRRA